MKAYFLTVVTLLDAVAVCEQAYYMKRMHPINPVFASSNERDHDDNGMGPQTALTVKSKPETKKPSLYKVFLLNDDYTPMDFVVHVLESYFNKSREEASRIMMHVHRRGVGLCGVYTYEIAETKAAQVLAAARKAQHPLQCTIEKE